MEMRTKLRQLREETGMEAIEGLLVITLMLFVLFYIWAFGFLLFQNWSVQYVANDTASRIAQTYAYPYSDPVTGFVSRAIRVQLSPYRYNSGGNIDGANAERAQKYAKYMLKQTGFTEYRGLDVEVNTKYDSLAQRNIEVKVTATYEVPFGFAMKYFGQNPYRTFTATGRAVCTDVKHYIYTVKNVNSFSSTFGSGLDSKFVSNVEKCIAYVRKFSTWLGDVKEDLFGGTGGSSAGGSDGGGIE